MGREANAVCRWQGQVGEARVLLESAELILRGTVRARIARADILDVAVRGDSLVLTLGSEALELELGAAEAEKWAAALLKPLPTLAEKLGVSPQTRVLAVGVLDVPEIADAVRGTLVESAGEADLLIAVLRSQADLQEAFAVAHGVPDAPLWCVYRKGKDAPIGDAAIRRFLRANGFVDSKTCAVSAEMTATRYAARAKEPGG